MTDTPIKSLIIKSPINAYKCVYRIYEDRLVLSEKKWLSEQDQDIKLFWISRRQVGLRSVGYMWYGVAAFFTFFAVMSFINGLSDDKGMRSFIAFVGCSIPCYALGLMFSARYRIYTNNTVNISFMRTGNDSEIDDFMETLHEVKLRWLARRSGDVNCENERAEFIILIKALYDDNVISENEYRLFREQVESKLFI